MKKLFVLVICCILLMSSVPQTAFADDWAIDYLDDDWVTSDESVLLSFYGDGTFIMNWGYYYEEEGYWYAEAISDDTIYLEMEGSMILSLMTAMYGASNADYHFEILVCNVDNFYLVQVYGDYTAKTSPCKLGFTRYGVTPDFSYKEDIPQETKEPEVQHVTVSDNGDHRSFTFKTGEEIEDLVFSTKSTEYNPRMAHFLACMARSAYDQNLVVSNYEELGFNVPIQDHYEKGDPFAPYTIGAKQLDNGTRLVLITIRGSGNLFDVTDNHTWTQTNFNIGNDALLRAHGWHSGFKASEEEVFNGLKAFLGDYIDTTNTVYVITGHSLGAAVGNLLAVRLSSEGVSSADVYDYNIACPNVAIGPEDICEWNYNGCHNNIINVGNWCDFVTHVPGVAFEPIGSGRKWKKYGVSYWFNNGYQVFPPAHFMDTYLDYLEKEYDETQFTDSEFVVQTVYCKCPVDVDIYDSAGNLIAGTENDVPNYNGYEIGEKAIIYIDGDQKIIQIPSDDELDVRIHATDDGEMKFGYSRDDLTSGKTLEEKWFESVDLADGKEMISKVGAKLTAEDVKLYVVDENQEITAEIMEDGSERLPDGTPEESESTSISDSQSTVSKNTFDTPSNTSENWESIFFIVMAIIVLIVVTALVIVIKKKK